MVQVCHRLSSCLPMQGHFGCFQFGVIINKTVMNNCMYRFLSEHKI